MLVPFGSDRIGTGSLRRTFRPDGDIGPHRAAGVDARVGIAQASSLLVEADWKSALPGQLYHSSNPPAKVRPAPTLQKMILSPSAKIPSSAAQPSAIETLAALVLPYLEIVTTNFS